MKRSSLVLPLIAALMTTSCKEQIDSLLGRKTEAAPVAPVEQPATPAPVKTPQPAPVKSDPVVKTAPKPAAPAPVVPKEEPVSELDRQLEEKYPLPDFKPLEEIVNGWNNVPNSVLGAIGPVTINVPLEYKLTVDGKAIGSSKVPAGHKAKVLQFKPGALLVTNQRDGSTKAVANIDDTDFKSLVQSLYDGKVAETSERILQARRVAKKALAQAGAGGGGAFSDGSSDPRFGPVRDYLAAGKLETGLLEEAKEWLWVGREDHGGRSYDVVLVNFEVDTIFGKFPNSMKCLLENGSVVKWVDAETGEERT